MIMESKIWSWVFFLFGFLEMLEMILISTFFSHSPKVQWQEDFSWMFLGTMNETVAVCQWPIMILFKIKISAKCPDLEIYQMNSEKCDIDYLSFGSFQCNFKINVGWSNKPRKDASVVSINTINTFYSFEYVNAYMRSDLEQILLFRCMSGLRTKKTEKKTHSFEWWKSWALVR